MGRIIYPIYRVCFGLVIALMGGLLGVWWYTMVYFQDWSWHFPLLILETCLWGVLLTFHSVVSFVEAKEYFQNGLE